MMSSSIAARTGRWGAALTLLAGLALMTWPDRTNEQLPFQTSTDNTMSTSTSEPDSAPIQADEFGSQTEPEPAASPTQEPPPVQQPQPEPSSAPKSEPTTTPTTAVPVEPINSADLVIGQDNAPIPSAWIKPALNTPYVDPTYGTSIRRITSADGTRFNRNDYSRRQAENADGSMFFTYHGDASFHVYDRVTTDEVQILNIAPGAEPQWHPTDPNRIRHIKGSNSYVGDLQLFETNVISGETRSIADLTDRIKAQYPDARYMNDRAEGSPSADGERYAWIVWNGDEERVGIVSYDLSSDTILGFTDIKDGDIDGNGMGLLDWVSMSPSGTHVVTGYWYGTFVSDVDFSNERQINAKGDHSDIAIGADGVDHYVYIDFSATRDGGWLVSVNLDTLERTRIFDLYRTQSNTSVHVSGKGYHQPGWVVVSTYSCKVDVGWACEKVMAVEMAGENRIVNLAHTHNCGEDYWTETHASVNRDFTRIYFNSDAGSCGIDAEVYELTVPPLP